MPLNGTEPATKAERRKHDRPYLVWAIAVFGFFTFIWVISPMYAYQQVLEMDSLKSLIFTTIGFVLLFIGAFKIYLEELDPRDNNYQDVTSLTIWKELTAVAFWPVVILAKATRDNYEYKKACIASVFQASRQR